jgi:hypothetical protein
MNKARENLAFVFLNVSGLNGSAILTLQLAAN